jgi:hypothetical protein
MIGDWQRISEAYSPTAPTGANAVADVPADGGQVVVEPVPNRTAADDRTVDVSHEKGARHPVGGQLGAGPAVAQPAGYAAQSSCGFQSSRNSNNSEANSACVERRARRPPCYR